MASSTTYFSILLFLTLLSSLHVHARDSKFFSKVTNDNNAKEVLPTKEHEQPLNKPEQEPNFIPQNQQNSGGYGLYGHESGQLPPTTTTENSYNKEFNNPNSNNGQYYNNDAYVTNPQGISDTRFMDKAYTTPITSNNNNYYNGGNMYNNRQHGIGEARLGVTNGNNGGNMYNNEKQGMSDTRFMENGKYYYDLNNENNYNLNNNANENSRGFDSRNEYYNNRGNSFRGQYGNNENSYEVNNSMEGYNGNQEEFQESQDEQFMP